jgi:Protein of unknown function (DUF2442)
MLRVNSIKYLQDHKLSVVLSNGVEGVFDVAPYLNKGIFKQLQNIEYFKQVNVNFVGICWPNGQDFSADTIEFHVTDLVA